MARQRNRSRRRRIVLVVVLIGAGLWGWRAWRSQDGPLDGAARVLTSTRPADSAERALATVTPPATETHDGMPLLTPPGRPKDGTDSSPPPPVAPAEATSQPAVTVDPIQAGKDFEAGKAARERGDLLEARRLLNQALHSGLPADRMASAREALADLADQTLFGREAIDGDPFAEYYVVRWGDTVARIAKKYRISEKLVADLNGIRDKNFIREGQRLKVVRGPFHATLSKKDHLLHLYLQNLYVRSYPVALGANGRTPSGRWKVSRHLENPSWVDPQTGQRWHADDPQNPIGEYWISLEGIEGDAVGQFGYGIHGTIEPETIGQDVSLGCVRLAADDIASTYKMLVPNESLVTIGE